MLVMQDLPMMLYTWTGNVMLIPYIGYSEFPWVVQLHLCCIATGLLLRWVIKVGGCGWSSVVSPKGSTQPQQHKAKTKIKIKKKLLSLIANLEYQSGMQLTGLNMPR